MFTKKTAKTNGQMTVEYSSDGRSVTMRNVKVNSSIETPIDSGTECEGSLPPRTYQCHSCHQRLTAERFPSGGKRLCIASGATRGDYYLPMVCLDCIETVKSGAFTVSALEALIGRKVGCGTDAWNTTRYFLGLASVYISTNCEESDRITEGYVYLCDGCRQYMSQWFSSTDDESFDAVERFIAALNVSRMDA